VLRPGLTSDVLRAGRGPGGRRGGRRAASKDHWEKPKRKYLRKTFTMPHGHTAVHPHGETHTMVNARVDWA
jgi:hypothetical protein